MCFLTHKKVLICLKIPLRQFNGFMAVLISVPSLFLDHP